MKLLILIIVILLMCSCRVKKDFPQSFEEAEIYMDNMFVPLDSLK